jgi:hypothetical protein
MNKTVVVFDGKEFDGGGWPTSGYPATLVGCIAWFNAKLALIPEEYRDKARCHITSYGRIWIEYDCRDKP